MNINCLSCAEDILNYLSELKQVIKIRISESSSGIKTELENLMDIIHVREQQWRDIYLASSEMKDQAAEILPKWPLLVMLFGAVFCLSGSAIFHLFSAHSEKTCRLLNRVDYAGIAILIVGSCYPPNYYLFHCEMSKFLLFINFFLLFNNNL